MKRTDHRMSATTDDKGYLGRLPCLTTNTVNPFSFNAGAAWAKTWASSTLDGHWPLAMAMTPAPLGRTERYTSSMSASPSSLYPYTTSVVTEGGLAGAWAARARAAEQTHTTTASRTTDERTRVPIRTLRSCGSRQENQSS